MCAALSEPLQQPYLQHRPGQLLLGPYRLAYDSLLQARLLQPSRREFLYTCTAGLASTSAASRGAGGGPVRMVTNTIEHRA